MIDVATGSARDRLAAALGVERWVDDVVGGGPYEDLEALVAAGDAAAAHLCDAELDEAVSHHPRIGDRAASSDRAADLSSAEQAGLGRADEGLDAVLRRGNAVYEDRFGRVFLIRVAGRSLWEVADELQRRLKNDPVAEAAEAKQQLREIAVLRLRALFDRPGGGRG